MVTIGLKYAFLFFVLSAIFFFFGAKIDFAFFILSGVFFILFAFCFYFFRDPVREIKKDENAILSPADGTVFEVSEVEEPEFMKGRVKLVKIFLSVFNVHLQRSPVAGEAKFIKIQPGLVLKANHPEASEKNRQNLIGISGKTPVLVKQIAGIIAQRCDLWVGLNQKVEQGGKIGVIHFGSQVDIYMPLDTDIKVKNGDKVAGGLTVIGTVKNR